jgi:hypothetical protein
MTEFMQPINPMRIITSTEERIFTCPVFAIAISNNHDVEYLTINGSFYNKGSMMFAEQLIEGKWTRLEYIERFKPETAGHKVI